MQTRQGRRVRARVLFRSAELHHCTPRDLRQLGELGIELICDLRSPRESRRRRPGQLWLPAPRIVNIPFHDPMLHDGQRGKLLGFLRGQDGGRRFDEFCRSYYRHLAFERATRIGEAITLLASPDNQPALIHCTAGKDRTGLLAALIQLLLDVPFPTVQAEYLRTNDDVGPRLERLLSTLWLGTLAPALSERMRRIVTTHPEHLAEIHEQLVSAHGSVEKYLCQLCQLHPGTPEQLRQRLIE